ncbi:hypothetical protein [Pseudoxanthomonas mexicana]|uniref:hypothetical protein n=1 Tax=Pseudoxanthomonas mexicana TaxID=128785 RepID=UPI0022F380A5|nr:hypothetical protein [Pseudoxanthomonas mexicana]WBX93167.1 hypothetical protein PE064_16015 [Pseudoxanthomonas mexicana]
MSSDASEPVGFVADLPEHWDKNSLFGAYAAIGRFNLCRAYDIAKLLERPLRAFQPRHPPSTTHLFEFMSWVGRLEVATDDITHPLLRRVIAKTRQDLKEVPLGWHRTHVFWCPECMKLDQHKAIHQHRALWFCPEHQIRLEQFCGHCGQHNGYRLFFDREPLRCRGCRCRLDGVDDGITSQPPAPKATSLEVGLTCQVAERIWVAGLPWSAGPPRPLGISPHDVRIHAAERMRAAEPSPQSRVLSQYIHFLPPRQVTNFPVRSREEAISRIAAHARSLARRFGHACMKNMHDGAGTHALPCPCHMGFLLWVSRTRTRQVETAPWSGDVNLLAYEGSHLGLCLSVSWLAHAQAQLMGKTSANDMTLAFWSLPSETNSPSPRKEEIPDTSAFVSHTFQWSAVRCSHVSGQVTRLGETLSALGGRSLPHADGDAIADASWIMNQITAAAGG